jgi:tetratricopeptide (TPR) repeat protein
MYKESIMISPVRQILVIGFFVTLLAVSAGCSMKQVVHRPMVQPDMTYAAAVKDLQTAARTTQICSTTGAFAQVRYFSNVTVSENGTVTWEFATPKYPNAVTMSLVGADLDLTVKDWGPTWMIELPGFIVFPTVRKENQLTRIKKIADDLYLIQQTLNNLAKKQRQELARFEAVAAKYRSLPIKPQVSEEQRRLVVQANSQTQQKQYLDAIVLYEKTIALDPISYPAAYFNLALLLAQEKAFNSAIYQMKHYLMLVPEAKDARSAQDKIYEWEGQIQETAR